MKEWVCFVLGFLTYTFSSSNQTGERNKFDMWLEKKIFGQNYSPAIISTSLKYNILGYCIHIHHWVYLLVIAVFCTSNNYIRMFCFGGIVQGVVVYDDWYLVIYKA